MTDEVTGDPKTWQNRRRMAYIALLAMVVATAYMFSPYMDVDRIEALESVITWFYTVMASIIAAYMGFTTWAYIKK
jgi:hypothetical protein